MKFFSWIWHDLLRRPYKLKQTVASGRGQPVLLIHGLGTNGASWKPLVRLAKNKKMHLIGFDLLGFGDSPKPANSEYSVHDHASAIVKSLSKSAKRQKIIIVGHSMGCLIASHIAWLYPKMVKQLVLYEPPLFADSPEFRSHARRKKLYFAFYQQIMQRPRILLAYSKAAARFKFAQGRSLSLNPNDWGPFEKSLKNTIMNQKAYDELKVINVPTDIIYGKFDFIVTRTDVREMLEANRYITFHLVNEMHDITDRAARYILRLIKVR